MGYKNNTKEYERILRLYSNDIYRIALLKLKNVSEAEDVFQNVFIKLYTCDNSFESDKHIKAWLLKVTVNECINVLKSSWNSKVLESINDNSSYDSSASVTANDNTEVWNVVAALPQKYRDVIFLFYHEQYSTEEISQILDISAPNVRTRLKRAREILRREVKDYEI